MNTRATNILLKLVTIAFGVVSSFAIAEIYVRVFHPHARDHVVPAGLFEIDSTLGWTLAPSYAGVHESRHFAVEYRTNRLGFRDRQRGARSPTTMRVLVFGDSQVFGWGVPATDRFSDLVESRMDEVELWNLGVPGYGLDQEVLSYETLDVDADGVVFFVSSVTLSRTAVDYIYRKPKPRFRVEPSGELRLDPVESGAASVSDVLYRLLSPFSLPYFVDRTLQELRRSPAPRGPSAPRVSAFGEVPARILERAKRRADRAGQRMALIVGVEDPASLGDVRAFAAEHGIEVFELALDASAGSLRFGTDDGHFNERAHRQIAAGLEAALRGSVLLRRLDSRSGPVEEGRLDEVHPNGEKRLPRRGVASALPSVNRIPRTEVAS